MPRIEPLHSERSRMEPLAHAKNCGQRRSADHVRDRRAVVKINLIETNIDFVSVFDCKI
jgi:hypothetical protein